MSTRKKKSRPSWTDVKAKLEEFDRKGLLSLIHDLYDANKGNQDFLHTRFVMGEEALATYKTTISRWMSPDLVRNQDVSVAKAKQAITAYRKAVGDPHGVAELMVYFCEEGAAFCADLAYEDEAYMNALVRMFQQALTTVASLAPTGQNLFLRRLDRVRNTSHQFGYGVGDDMDDLLAKFQYRPGASA